VDKPVLGVFVSREGTPAALLRAPRRVAAFPYPESAAHALGRAVERAEWLRAPLGRTLELDGIDGVAAAALVARVLEGSTDTWLEPADARALLAAYGIPVVDERTADSVEGAVAAAEAIGFPVVVKTAQPGAHKTEQGLVALDLHDGAEVAEAAARIGAPVIVQPMVRGGAELLAGVVQDPVFGPLVAFGPGGVFAELIGQAQFRIAPLTDADADALVLTGKAGRLVAGFRGAAASDAAALADVVLRLSRLAEDLPQVAELDCNPVIALPDGCVVVDARVRLRPSDRVEHTKTW
jgi:acyl-CoA synthetase (NDP forming)